jgi:DNA-binding NarL/FixJ family response regulator
VDGCACTAHNSINTRLADYWFIYWFVKGARGAEFTNQNQKEKVLMVKDLLKVLVVDDHVMVRKGIRALLNEYDDICVVGEAGNGLDAVKLTEGLKPDLVLMDLSMPGIDGIEAIKRIIAADPCQRIIVITAHLGADRLDEAMKAGAIGYVVKDDQPGDLISSIRIAFPQEPALEPVIAWNELTQMPFKQLFPC